MEAEVLPYILSLVFLLIAFATYNGYLSQIKLKHVPTSRPNLSVIVSLKNEQQHIEILLKTFDKLNYPKENSEIIFVDDNSSDETYEILNQLISDKLNYTLLKAVNKKFIGKKGALSIGIEKAKNDFIVITDADCEPKTEWLERIAFKLSEGFDFVFGVAPIKSGKTFVQKLSAFENLRNTFLSISAVGLNIPYSAAARSFAFRKSSFEKLGGYANTTETLSGDDDLLLREAVKNKMKIGTLIDPDAFVFSESPKTFRDYFKQKKRHLQTSFYYLLPQKLFLGLWHIVNLISLFSIAFIFISPTFAIPFFVKMIYDFLTILKHQKQLGHNFRFYEIPFLQIAFEIFLVINFINSLTGKVEWK